MVVKCIIPTATCDCLEKRMRRSVLILVAALLVASLPRVDAAQPAPRLWLHRSILENAPRPPVVSALALAEASASPYAIIQFRGPIAHDDRAALEQTGVTVLEYLPDFAYLVRGSPAQLAMAVGLPQTYARVPFTAADKLAPALLRADSLLQIAALPSVRWIEPATRPRLLNDVARAIMHVNSAWQGRGLYGAGQVIAVADSGLDTGDPATISPDFAGRIVASHVLSAGGDLGDNFGHGTHV